MANNPTAKPGGDPGDMSGIERFIAMSLGVKPEEVTMTPEPEAQPSVETPPGDVQPPEKPAGNKPDEHPPAAEKPVTPAASAPTAQALTPDVVANIAAQAAAKVIEGTRTPPPKPEDKPDPDAGLSVAEKQELSVMARMAELYPDKYKDAPTKYRDSIKKLTDYKAKWEAEHQGEEFDEDAEEHEAWMESNVYAFDESDFESAKVDLLVEERLIRQTKLQEEQQRKQREAEKARSQQLEQKRGAIVQGQIKAAKLFLKGLGPDFEGVLKDDGTIDEAKLTAARSSLGEIANDIESNWNRLDAEVSELHAVMSGAKDFDPNNKLHVDLGNFVGHQEQEILSWAPKDRADQDGRQFCTLEQYYRLPQQERGAYWTLTPDAIAKIRAQKMAASLTQLAKREEEIFLRVAKRKGVQLPSNGSVPPQANTGQGAQTPVPTVRKPQTPVGGGGPRVAPATNGSNAAGDDPLSMFYLKTL